MLQFLRVVWAFVTIDLNTINIDDDNFDEDHPETIVPFGLMAWCIKDKQRKANKNDRRKSNAYSKASNLSVGLVYDKRRKAMER